MPLRLPLNSPELPPPRRVSALVLGVAVLLGIGACGVHTEDGAPQLPGVPTRSEYAAAAFLKTEIAATRAWLDRASSSPTAQEALRTQLKVLTARLSEAGEPPLTSGAPAPQASPPPMDVEQVPASDRPLAVSLRAARSRLASDLGVTMPPLPTTGAQFSHASTADAIHAARFTVDTALARRAAPSPAVAQAASSLLQMLESHTPVTTTGPRPLAYPVPAPGTGIPAFRQAVAQRWAAVEAALVREAEHSPTPAAIAGRLAQVEAARIAWGGAASALPGLVSA